MSTEQRGPLADQSVRGAGLMRERLTWPDGSTRAVLVDGVCVLCRGTGEVWISGRMLPCSCDAVQTLNHRLRARIEELEAELAEVRQG